MLSRKLRYAQIKCGDIMRFYLCAHSPVFVSLCECNNERFCSAIKGEQVLLAVGTIMHCGHTSDVKGKVSCGES
jgi:hypothetical protein